MRISKFVSGVLAVLAVTLGACGSDVREPDAPVVADGDYVSLYVEKAGDDLTRSAAWGETAFGTGMSFGFTVYTGQFEVIDGEHSNIKATLGEDGKWVLDRDVKIKKGERYWVRAYYPYTEEVNAEAIYPDPSMDVMVSDLCIPSEDGGLKLTFMHVYAELEVRIEGAESVGDAEVLVRLKNGYMYDGDMPTQNIGKWLCDMNSLDTMLGRDEPYKPVWEPTELLFATAVSAGNISSVYDFVAPVFNGGSGSRQDMVMSLSAYGTDIKIDNKEIKRWFPTWNAGYRYRYTIKIDKDPETGDVTIFLNNQDISIIGWQTGEDF